jgi:hypothetical protein
MEQHLLAYFIGIFIVFASHAYMLYKPEQALMTMQQHCYINILAAALIAYYFLQKEGYISF